MNDDELYYCFNQDIITYLNSKNILHCAGVGSRGKKGGKVYYVDKRLLSALLEWIDS